MTMIINSFINSFTYTSVVIASYSYSNSLFKRSFSTALMRTPFTAVNNRANKHPIVAGVSKHQQLVPRQYIECHSNSDDKKQLFEQYSKSYFRTIPKAYDGKFIRRRRRNNEMANSE